MKQIFPKEIVNNTIEVHQFKHSKKSSVIYTILLIGLLSAFLALPFIKISVYNNTNGIIRPDKERITIQNISNGKVTFINLKNNQKVIKGDTLLIINNSSIQQKLIENTYQSSELQKFISDISNLVKGKVKGLKSAKYIQEYAVYKQKLDELQTRFRKITDDYKRDKLLFNKGLVSKINLNQTKLNYDLAQNAIYQLIKSTKNTWQSQLVSYKNQLKSLESTQIQLEQNRELSIITAPFTGTLLNVQGVEKGSFITAGMQLAQLSPKGNLIVECYVSPNNIGLLNKKSKVNFQISAFNYNQWGLATGKIVDIAEDIQFINNTPMFRVLCSLDQNYLQLKNGFKGCLKKGMTLNARFEITERTLFDLLYDKVDDWLNPNSQTKTQTEKL